MKTVYKYELPVTDRCMIQMPARAEILTVQVQNGKPCVWAVVDTDNSERSYEFRVAGTGHPLDIEEGVWNYVGTFQIHDGALVFHVFRMIY